MPNEISQLEEEAISASAILSGKVVARVIRHGPTEVLVEFTDGARLFVDQAGAVLELSITVCE
jgi:hypothetical protein